MIKHFLSAILVFSAAFSMSAIEITPGSLESKISDPESVTDLTLTGRANAADFKFISQKMNSLESLDLSGLQGIDAVTDVFFGNISSHPANNIPGNAFAGLPQLMSLALPTFDGLTIGDGAFAGADITSLTIPANVARVGSGAFSACESLQTLVCLASNIMSDAFSGCYSLKSSSFSKPVALPDGVFANCTALNEIQGDFTAIGARAFIGCSALREFPFSENLTSIGERAFMEAGLEQIDLSDCTKLASVGDWAFANMPRLAKVNMGNVANIGNGIVFDCPALTEFVTAGSTKAIPDFAFAKSKMTNASATVHNDIETIGDYALSGMSNVAEFALPENLVSLGDHAMERMTGLKNIHADALGTVPEIGEDVWEGVSQKDVNLIVANDMFDPFKNADQWREFSVMKTSSSVDAVITEEISQLRARFDGNTLMVSIDGVDINRISLYNQSGALLVTGTPVDSLVTIDTTDFPTNIFIIRAELADGRVAVLKLGRRI